MDDAWETTHGLNPNDASDRNLVTLSGYTALEVYLNSLVGETIELKFATSVPDIAIRGLIVFPTVATEQISIRSSEPLVSAELFGINGNCIEKFRLSESDTFSVNNYPTGSYILKIQAESGRIQFVKIFRM